jgi:hypothetical protein
MTSSTCHDRTAVSQRLAWLGRFALRFVLLSSALVAYGSFPRSIAVQTEIESLVQEELASSHHDDLRVKLRGSAMRRVGRVAAYSRPLKPFGSTGARAATLGPHISCGASLPLRC